MTPRPDLVSARALRLALEHADVAQAVADLLDAARGRPGPLDAALARLRRGVEPGRSSAVVTRAVALVTEARQALPSAPDHSEVSSEG